MYLLAYDAEVSLASPLYILNNAGAGFTKPLRLTKAGLSD